MYISSQTVIVVLLIAAVLSLIERRLQINYLQCAGRLLSGAFLFQFATHFSSPRFYLFAGLGIFWFAVGVRDLLRQLASRRVEATD